MKYLVSTVETYRVDTENEAKNLIESAKKDGDFVLSKYSSEFKEVKQKGEVVEEYFKVSLTKVFTDIKDPDGNLLPYYAKQNNWITDDDIEENNEIPDNAIPSF